MVLYIVLFFESPVATFVLGPNTFLSTLFSKTVSLCSSLNVRDQISQPNENQKQN